MEHTKNIHDLRFDSENQTLRGRVLNSRDHNVTTTDSGCTLPQCAGMQAVKYVDDQHVPKRHLYRVAREVRPRPTHTR